MDICKYNSCTGCGVCSNACPKGAISMVDGEYGEIRPVIDDNKCIQCGLCKNVCPVNKKPITHYPLKVYAAWRNPSDAVKRRFSASGGVAAVLAEYFIKSGGKVCGVQYNDNCEPVFVLTDDLNELESFKGSKYVQAIPGCIYSDVKRSLAAGDKVLFIGVTCQVAGLLNYLNKMEKDNLTVVDLLCHGVSPHSYLREHINRLSKRYKLKDISNITFRTNIQKRNFALTLWNKTGKELYHMTAYEDNYFYGFLTGATLRDSCYICNYKGTDRISDISIGDFIGLGEKITFEYNTKQVSLVMPNTEKGKLLIDQCVDQLYIVERTMEEALEKGTSLKHPFPKSEKRDEFLGLYSRFGFNKAADKVFGCDILKRKLQRYFKIIKKRIAE